MLLARFSKVFGHLKMQVSNSVVISQSVETSLDAGLCS